MTDTPLPHRPTDDSEQLYFEGSPLLRGDIHVVLLWGAVGLVVIGAVVANWVHHVVTLPAWLAAVVILLGIALLLVPSMVRRTLKYRITNYRIDVTTGLLSRNVDTTELWHVEDLKLHQSLMDRIFNVGTITVISHDDTTPRIDLRGLPHPQTLFREIEQRVIAVKRQRGVLKMDTGT